MSSESHLTASPARVHRRWAARVRAALAVVASLSLTACGGWWDDKPEVTPAATEDVVAAAPSPVVLSPTILGNLEIDISGIGAQNPTSALRWDEGSQRRQTLSASGRASINAVAPVAGGLDLKVSSISTIDSGGFRYLTATFLVRNAQSCSTPGTCTPYTTPRSNVTLMAAISTAIPGTPFARFLRQDDTPAAPALASQLVPSHGMQTAPGGVAVDPRLASMQLYRESELPTIAGVDLLPYGYVVNHVSNGTRTLPANPAPNQFDGWVSIGYRIPLQANSADNPFKMTLRVRAVEDSSTRVSQSLEEASAAGDQAAAARATALNANELIVPCERTPLLTIGSPICDVRVAGLAASPTATIMKSARNRLSLMMNIGLDCYWCNFPLFVNLVNAAEAWRYNWDSNYDPSLILKDSKGWVTKINGTGVARTILGYPAEVGAYRISWKGKGRMQIVSNQTQSVIANVVATADGTQSFNLPVSSEIRLDILSTDATDYLRDIVVVAERYATTYVDQPFYPSTLAFLQKFRGLRFMDFLVINNSTQSTLADRVTDSYYSQAAIAGSYEMAVKLCNATARDCWLNIPHRATDEYVTEVARIVRDRLDPSLKAYIEYSNEAWNFTFDQARYMRDTALAQNFPGNDSYTNGGIYYARRSVQIFGIFQQVLGSSAGQRLVRVLAGQTVNPYLAEFHLNEAAGRLDAYAVAPYFGHESDGGFGGAAKTWTLDQLFAHLTGPALTQVTSELQAMQTLLSQRSVPMIAYEGGQHLVDWSGDTTLTNLYIAANRDPRMTSLYGAYLDRWRAAGGRDMALFNAVGPYTRFGSWGLKESVAQPDAQAPKYLGVIDWMSRNLKWW